MLKTISAVLLAMSVLAAPTFAATAKTEQTPITKSATVTKSAHVKKHSLHAHAKLNHRRHYARHHRIHTKMAGKIHKTLKVSKLHKTHTPLKVSAKPVKHPAKRG